MSNVAIIDYGSGNLHSILKACQHVADSHTVSLVEDVDAIAKASHIILPGVGAFGDCRQGIQAVDGLWEAIEDAVHNQGKWFLGICVGMQLMAKKGLEHGEHEGFGWVDGTVKKLELDDKSLKIPHMGWNALKMDDGNPLFEGIKDGDHAYFVHSYHMEVANSDVVIASTEYGHPITAAIAKDNFMGTQFHPEKSQDVGLKLLANFMQL